MIALLALGAAVLAVLVWAGRRPARLARPMRLARALVAALAAASAVAAALRGGWIIALALVALSVWLGIGSARGGAAQASGSGMTLEEARSTLGVEPGASAAEIEAAWRRLMQRAHPDQGGSTGLAARLNAARDRLLK